MSGTSSSNPLSTAGLQAVATPVIAPGSTVLTVGAGKEYATLGAALAASADGNTILVDAGTYTNDFGSVGSKVSIIGVGGMVNLVATTQPPNGKAILTVDTDCTMQNLSFSGCTVPDGNGAGIRYEGGSLTLQNCAFSNNQNGLLSASIPGGTLTIQHCDFGFNGSGTGYTHNLYVGAIDQLIVEDSRFHDVSVGHEIKSRAANTMITGNVIADGPTSTASYSIDLPDGGTAVVTGNLIEKGPQAENQAAVHFGGEGIPYAGSSLLVQGNQFVNDRGAGTVGVLNQTPISVAIKDNSFTGFANAQVAYGPAQETGNTDGAGVLLPDATLAGILPGSTTFFTADADPHSFTFTSSDTAVQGGAGHLTLTAQAGHVIAVGGAGGIDFTEIGGSGGNQVVTLAGSTNAITIGGQDSIDSEGTDTITTGHGNVGGQVGGTAVISDGTGNDAWGITGTAVVTAHDGAPQFSVGAHGNVTVLGQTNFTAFSSNGGMERYDVTQDGTADGSSPAGTTEVAATITGGAVVAAVYNDLSHIRTSSGGQGALIQLQAGDAAITSGGADTIWAGSGALTTQVSGAAVIHAGTGALSVFSRGLSGATVWGAGGTTLIAGDTGGITYRGGDQASTVQAVLSNITLLGGAGLLTVQAGARQTITGGSGGLLMTEDAQSGANQITTASGSSNALQVNNDCIESWGADSISGGAAGSAIHVHGTATIQDGQAGNSLEVSGQATLLGGAGGDNVTLDQGASATIQAGAGGLYLNETGATLHLSVGAGTAAAATALVQGGSANVQVGADRGVQVNTNAGTSTAVTVDGGSTLVATYGADQVRTGAGSAWVQLRAAGAEVWGGTGMLSIQDQDWNSGDRQIIHGGSGSLHVLNDCGALTFFGSSGSASFDGAGAGLAIQGGSGQVNLAAGGGGALSFTGGTGNASLGLSQNGGSIQFGSGDATVNEWAWGAAVAYTCAAGHGGGVQVINGFRVGTDQLTLQGVSVQTLAIVAGSTLLTLTDGTSVQLAGIQASAASLRLSVAAQPGATPPGTPQPGAPTSAAPQPAANGSLVLHLSEDAWQGDAQFAISVDGVQQGGVQTATALHGLGQTQDIALGPLTAGTHSIAVTFVNDAWGGTVQTDRNLYLDGATLGGQAVPHAAAPLYWNQTVSLQVTVPAAVPSLAAADASTPAAAASPGGAGAVTGSSAAPSFAVTDTTTGQSQQSAGVAYAGPVATLQSQLIWAGADGIAVTAATPNVFLHGGAGDDALTATGGANVLDGGGGSNFLVGGTGADGGTDTFFIDGRSGTTWSTIVNFHHGDDVTIWGYQAGVSTLPWTASEGADGYKGATIHAELAGAGTGVNASATFAGISLADVQAKFTTTSGIVGGLSYLNVAYKG